MTVTTTTTASKRTARSGTVIAAAVQAPSRQMLFPQRQRCVVCRHKLGAGVSDPVYDGLYCSPRCAGVPRPAAVPQDAPRECKTQRENQWVFKRRYRCEQEIPKLLREDPSTSWYWCTHCRHLHIGHSRLGEREALRVLTDPQALADFLIKRRGKVLRTEVARVAGIRPIRLKELEEPVAGQRVDLQALFAVLDVLRSRVAVTMQQQ